MYNNLAKEGILDNFINLQKELEAFACADLPCEIMNDSNLSYVVKLSYDAVYLTNIRVISETQPFLLLSKTDRASGIITSKPGYIEGFCVPAKCIRKDVAMLNWESELKSSVWILSRPIMEAIYALRFDMEIT